MLRTALWTSIGAALCLLVMETVLSIASVNGMGQMGLVAGVNLLLIPVVLPLSLVISISLQLFNRVWQGTFSALKLKPINALWLSLYTAVVLSTTLKAGLWIGSVVHRRFKQMGYQHLAIILTTVGILLLAVAVYAPFCALCRWCIQRVNRPQFGAGLTWAHAVLIMLAVAGGGIIYLPDVLPLLASVDLRILWLGWVWVGGLLLVHLYQPSLRIEQPKWLAGLCLLLVACLAGAGTLLDRVYPLSGQVLRHTVLTKHVLNQYQRLTDKDGDGVSAAFGGRDCNDADAGITPGRLDIPGDGIDQNCTGSDFVDAPQSPTRLAVKAPLTELRPNVILLTIDALRYDRISEDMPFLKGLSDRSVNFTNAYSHGASTYWSIASLLTSKIPSRLIMGRDQTPVGTETLLPELFQRHGWTTHLFANVTVFFVRGLSQGFRHSDKNYATSHYSVHGAKPAAKHMTDGMLREIGKLRRNKAEKPFFLWGHYYDPHDPYFEVEGFPSEGDDDFSRYRAICRSVDKSLELFVNRLKKLGVWEKTVLIITADHGEEFGEHGGRFHGKSLYEEMTRVPLIVRIPGIEPRRVDMPVGQIDIAPTLLGLLGLPSFSGYRGQNHASSIVQNKPFKSAPVMLEVLPDSNYNGHILGMRIGSMKVLYSPRMHFFEVYDLDVDPGEQNNIADAHPELRARILGEVDRHLYHLALGKTGAKKPLGTPKGFPRSIRKPKR